MSTPAQPIPRQSPANPSSSVPEPRNQPRGTYKPRITQTAVVAEAMRGNSKRGIARKLKIHARTVARILKENQVAEYQRVASAMVDASLPDAADVVVDEIIVKRDATCALAVLRGRGVLKSDATTTVNIAAIGVSVPEWLAELAAPRRISSESQAKTIDVSAAESESK